MGGPTVLDLVAGRVIRMSGTASPVGWSPNGRLLLVAADGTSRLWGPDGRSTPTDLPPGDPLYGPTLARVAIRPPIGGTVLVLIGRGTTLTLPADSGSSAIWAPDGRSCVVTTAGQGTPMVLVRVGLP